MVDTQSNMYFSVLNSSTSAVENQVKNLIQKTEQNKKMYILKSLAQQKMLTHLNMGMWVARLNKKAELSE